LVEPLRSQLDEGRFGVVAAVALSYIPAHEQFTVANVLDSAKYRLDSGKAQALRQISKIKPIDRGMIEKMLSGVKEPKAFNSAGYRLKPQIISRYFKPEQKPDEIETIITAALEFYYAHQAEKGVTLHDE
jgi:ParB family chromosome partitioning protein